MGFIDTVQDWDGTNFEDGMSEIWVSKLKDVLDVFSNTIDNGN